MKRAVLELSNVSVLVAALCSSACGTDPGDLGRASTSDTAATTSGFGQDGGQVGATGSADPASGQNGSQVTDTTAGGSNGRAGMGSTSVTNGGERDAGATTGASTGGMDSGGGDTGTTGTGGEEEAPVCDVADSSEFEPSNVGGGGTPSKETDHFRIFGSGDLETTANNLEAAYACFVEDGCWQSPGVSITSDDGQHHKMNIYGVGSLGGAAGVMQYDSGAGLSYLEVLDRSLPDPRVTVHEFGHGLTLASKGWVDQQRTGAWWETVANFVADSFLTSPHCEDARDRFGVPEGNTLIRLDAVISRSYLGIVDANDQGGANYYEAWPFLTYLTNNPDGYPGLGRMTLPSMFEQHNGRNETPLHVLERVAAPVKVQTILGRYWARMAYLDIEHPKAQEAFFSARSRLDFANLDAVGGGTYRVRSSRQPAYGGANIIPLDVTGGEASVEITNLGNGLPESNFTATFSIRGADGSVRYVDLQGGAGQTTVGSGEEASLVVVNTPDTLYSYDPFDSSGPAVQGLNYEVRLMGASPAD